MGTYEALRAEMNRLNSKKGRGEFSGFLAEYVYSHLSLLDIVLLIGGRPPSYLYGASARRLLEHPKPKAIADKALTLMRVSEDWRTFQHLYGKGPGRRKEIEFEAVGESLIVFPVGRSTNVGR